MEKTLSLLVESMMEQLRPHITQDVMLSQDMIADQIHDSRAALVPRLYAEKNTFDGWFQERNYESEIIKTITIGGYSYSLKVPTNRIVLDGPLMSDMSFKNIRFFGSHDVGSEPFNRVTQEQFLTNKHQRYGNNQPIYFVDGSTIYIQNAMDMMYYRSSMCYANPTLVDGYSWDTTLYPLPLTAHRKMEIILFQHLGPKLQMPVDILNNLLDETKNAPVMQQVRQTEQQQQQ